MSNIRGAMDESFRVSRYSAFRRQRLRVARGKIWRDMEKCWRHSWNKNSCSTQRYQYHWAAMNTLRARVTSLKLCRENMRKKTEVFKGCHSNGYTERNKTLHVDSPRLDLHFVSLPRRCISNSLGAMAENVIFCRFWAKNLPFSAGYHSNELVSQLLAANMFAQPQRLHDQGI